MVSNTNVPMTPGIFPPRIFQRWAGFGLICVNRAKSRGAICSIRFAIGSSYKQRLLSFLFVKARLAIPPLLYQYTTAVLYLSINRRLFSSGISKVFSEYAMDLPCVSIFFRSQYIYTKYLKRSFQVQAFLAFWRYTEIVERTAVCLTSSAVFLFAAFPFCHTDRYDFDFPSF